MSVDPPVGSQGQQVYTVNIKCSVDSPHSVAGAGDAADVSRALRGVRAVICPSKLGALLGAAVKQQVEHIVLLSSTGRCCHYSA